MLIRHAASKAKCLLTWLLAVKHKIIAANFDEHTRHIQHFS